MAKVLDLLKKLSAKTGINIENEELKPFVEAVSALEAEIPENINFLEGLLTKEDAKNEPEVKSHFYGKFADQYDHVVEKQFEALGVPKEVILDIRKGETSSFKRIEKLTEKAKEQIAKAIDPEVFKGKEAEMRKQIEALTAERQSLQEINENDKRIFGEQIESMQISHFLEDKARKFAVIDDIPEDYIGLVKTQSIEKAMREHSVKPAKRDGKIVLVNATDPTLLAKADITFESIIEKGFANDRLLKMEGKKKDEGEDHNKNPFKRTDGGSGEAKSIFQQNIEAAKRSMATVNED